MKKLVCVLALAAMFSIVFATGVKAESVMGFIYKSAQEPGSGSGSVTPAKCGSATCTSYFGVVALGDCSVATAMKNGGVKSLSHYDTDTKNIVGFKKVTVKAYGQ